MTFPLPRRRKSSQDSQNKASTISIGFFIIYRISVIIPVWGQIKRAIL
uniref:Uncharacterized protein n=1 Tax=Siphoviridae sp. ctCCX1 TaxID=2823567 RepID=A0A8S5LDH4_9CAUD|nr:MAG TPA: hypothetical protein [Siphoviridae sp. ctCCX1]DAX15631.1 MAG TPA: hypothetical protein [Caudoviricetes sp.]